MMQEYSAAKFVRELANDPRVLLVDVRSPAEYQLVHAPGAVNIPLNTLSPGLVAALAQKVKIVFICKGGARSKKACALSPDDNVGNIVGGTEGWIASGLPVERKEGRMSLERQVRIAAGSLVLIGAVSGFALHSAFFGISAFVGAGLVFAGITDWCGMALLLSRMPWNKA